MPIVNFHIPYAPNDINIPIIQGIIDSFIFALSSTLCIAKLIPIITADINVTIKAIVSSTPDTMFDILDKPASSMSFGTACMSLSIPFSSSSLFIFKKLSPASIILSNENGLSSVAFEYNGILNINNILINVIYHRCPPFELVDIIIPKTKSLVNKKLYFVHDFVKIALSVK